MIRRIILGTALAAASPVVAQTAPPGQVAPPTEAAQDAVVLKVVGDMRAGRHDAALARLDVLLAAYDRAYADEKRMIFCADGMEETLASMLLAAGMKRSAVAIPPGWCGTLFMKGFVLADAKRFSEAQAFMERAIAMRPNEAHYLNELGYILQQQRQWQASYDAYDKARGTSAAVRRPAEKGRAMRGMGFARIEMGKWDEAEALFRECLALDPNDRMAAQELKYIADTRPKT